MWAGGLAFAESFDYTRPGLDESLRQSRARLGAPNADFLIIHDLEPERHGDQGIHTRLDELATDEGQGWKWLCEQRDDAKTIGGIGAGLNRLDMAWEFWNRGIDVDFFLVAGRLTLLENTKTDGPIGESVTRFLEECKKRDTRLLLGGVFNSGILATGPDDPSAKFDYGAAPAHVVERVRAVKAVCDAHSTPLAAAAMQFPMARHGQAGDGAAVGSGQGAAIIPGVDSVAQLRQNLELLEKPVPEALWRDLITEGLCD
jgi:D-threo-aldose 1-dehydrogenase